MDISKVKEIIEGGVSDSVEKMRKYSDLLNMHVTGANVEEHTEKLNQHESDVQRKLRKRLIKSNKSVMSFLSRPVDKVFTAKGGNIDYNLSQGQIRRLKDFTSNVSKGLNIKEYSYKFIKDTYLIDPNAFVMLDIDKTSNIQTQIFKSKDFIYIENDGNNVESVVFNPITYEDDDRGYYRVLDKDTDAIYIKDGDNVYLQEDTEISNFFGFVPAYILGDKYSYNENMFVSLLDPILEDADEHLRDVSINIVHKLSHGYAKYWSYPEDCSTCGGDGTIKRVINEEVREAVCHTCNGGGVKNHKNASDTMLIGIPKEGEPIFAPNVAGYINPSIEVWKQYKEDIADLKDNMFQTLWGNYFSTSGKNETATGRMLNVQPEAERTVSISRTFSEIHQFILKCYGIALFQNTSYMPTVNYGTRYLMESPDEILEKYTEAVDKGLPAVIQVDLLDKYYQNEYATNDTAYIKKKKVIAVDPFPSLSAKDVKELGVSDEDLMLKIYYPQWVNQLAEAKILLMTVEELKKDLQQFTNNKKLKDEVQKITNEPT